MKTPLLLKLIDKYSFTYIFIGWIVMILFFGIIYALGSDVFFEEPVTFSEAIYFSFTVSPTRGFEDLTPIGFGRFIAIVESILTLFTYGIVISKLVTFKQRVILEEVYTISFSERINRLRSMLYLFRADLNRIIMHIQDGKKNPSLLKESTVYVHHFMNTMHDIDTLLHHREDDDQFIKSVDFTTFELILNSIIVSMDKLIEFLFTVQQHKIPLNTNLFSASINKISFINETILHHYKEIDDIRIKNKLDILDTLNKKLKQEHSQEAEKK